MDNEGLIHLKKEYEARSKQKYKRDSKERLRAIASKKIQTTMIGALDSIEKHLGFLWADGNNDSLKDIYEIVRQEILDRGNDQIRNLSTELEQYEIEWLRYNISLQVKPKKEQ